MTKFSDNGSQVLVEGQDPISSLRVARTVLTPLSHSENEHTNYISVCIFIPPPSPASVKLIFCGLVFLEKRRACGSGKFAITECKLRGIFRCFLETRKNRLRFGNVFIVHLKRTEIH